MAQESRKRTFRFRPTSRHLGRLEAAAVIDAQPASLYRLGRLRISPPVEYISKCDVSHNLGGPCRGNFRHDRNPEGPQVSRFGG